MFVAAKNLKIKAVRMVSPTELFSDMSTSPPPRDANRAPDAAQALAAGSPWEVSASPPREDIAAGPKLRRSERSNAGSRRPSSPASATGESRGLNHLSMSRRRPGALAVASPTASASPRDSQAPASAPPRSAGASRSKMPDKETLQSYDSLTQAEAAGNHGCSIRTLHRACVQYGVQLSRVKKLTEEGARSIFIERAQGVKRREIAERHGISEKLVLLIANKQAWQGATRHVFTSTLSIAFIYFSNYTMALTFENCG
jgi:hypothetical protein